MSKPRIKLREVSAEEASAVRKLARARTAAKQLVQRAQVIEALLDDATLTVSEAGCRVGFGSNASGPLWVKRFNEQGLAGLEDKPRAGAPVTHTQVVRSQVIALALQKPRALGYPFELWTLERLQTAMQEQHSVHLARSTIWAWLEAEGLAWQRQQSWFQDPQHHDPQFVEKRGPSSLPT
jgi:transposase